MYLLINLFGMGNSSGHQDNLKIKILAGDTQSLSLFDFHSEQKVQFVADLKFPSILGFLNGELVYQALDNVNPQIQQIYRIQRNNFKDIIIRELFDRDDLGENLEQMRIWKVVSEAELMPLMEGDQLKIGKTRFTLKQLVKKKNSNQAHKMQSNIINDRQETERLDITRINQPLSKVTEGQCRLCFENSESLDNPLVSLCKCSGSVKYIHYECLKDWICNNIKKDKSTNCLSYSYLQPTSCQLCKQQISKCFTYQGQNFSLLEFQKMQPPYAVFQNKFYDQQINKTRVSVLNISIPETNEITIGRNHHSQVILKDISVSRNHCQMLYKQGELFIKDKKSKFGTLVSPQNGFEFNSITGVKLQFESKIIQIFEEKTLNNCCCAANDTYFIEINKNLKDHSF